jgi:nitrite reductase/ring-hydroxylating ferredoxin subunit
MSRQNLRDVVVESVTFLDADDPPRWAGRLQISGNHRPIDILIFNIQGGFRAFPALCPHEGYNLTHCPLRNENILVCPAHSLRIDLKTSGFRVKEDSGRFLVAMDETSLFGIAENRIGTISGNEDSKTVVQLRKEIDELRLTNLKQEKQTLVITQSMDAMLIDPAFRSFKRHI